MSDRHIDRLLIIAGLLAARIFLFILNDIIDPDEINFGSEPANHPSESAHN